MWTKFAAAAFAASLLVPGVNAQAQTSRYNPAQVDPNTTRTNSAPNQVPPGVLPDAPPIYRNGSEIPAPNSIDDAKSAIPLPTGPIEPYMLTKEHGPFMVLAYSFRGPDAPRQALALVLELRSKYKLPAYILLPKKFPGRSIIRGVPPQAPQFAMKDDVGLPELIRTLDEAAVMVGNEKTTKDAFDLMNKIKKIHPECIDGVPQMWHVRKGKGLSRAIATANPFVPAEELFARQPDVMLATMNGGPHNIRNCPGRYTLQVANFTGRSAFVEKNESSAGLMSGFLAEKSPLATAADDAERLAEALSRDKEIQKLGCQPYVYHDRFSSRVTLGSFNVPNDPNAQRLHDRLREIAVDLNNRRVTDVMIVPATALMDLAPIKPKLALADTATARK